MKKTQDLIDLVRLRYPDWDGFAHPPFVEEEIAYKQATIAKTQELLSKEVLDELIAINKFAEIISRVEKVARDNNLLWQRVPSAGDLAVLYQSDLDQPTFCTQIRNLLYADRPSPDRLQSFSDYLASHNWPNKWPLPTYLLFMAHPHTEMFVKPQAATWFLKFMGETVTVQGEPTAVTYRLILEHTKSLREEMGATDMVQIQSLLWVAYRESKKQIGKLDAKGQVELDVPPTKPLIPTGYKQQRSKSATGIAMHETNDIYATAVAQPPYSLTQCAADTGYDEAELARWVKAIQRKGQAILYGPPGTGKTFMAQKLAQHLIGGQTGEVDLVQFHPAYAYEDFMQGLRPITDANGTLRYEMVNGRFKQFCEKVDRLATAVFIIDEINRANLASVFGELMYLLEYRDHAIPLAGGGTFAIPRHIHIIATMNTADRSIALVDHALRRRFAFIHLAPNWDVLRHYHESPDFPIENLITILKRLNQHINDPHYAIGHSFFLHEKLADHLPDIWQMEIEPYLEEYFFNQTDRVETFRWPNIKKDLTDF